MFDYYYWLLRHYYVIITSLLRYYYVIITSLLRHYYCNNGSIITVIMGLLLPIITKSIMGNNESIITHYEPTQLADDLLLIVTSWREYWWPTIGPFSSLWSTVLLSHLNSQTETFGPAPAHMWSCLLNYWY